VAAFLAVLATFYAPLYFILSPDSHDPVFFAVLVVIPLASVANVRRTYRQRLNASRGAELTADERRTAARACRDGRPPADINLRWVATTIAEICVERTRRMPLQIAGYAGLLVGMAAIILLRTSPWFLFGVPIWAAILGTSLRTAWRRRGEALAYLAALDTTPVRSG
jgi:hypothetical protein